jgi:mycofactocin system transcriptional regulator
MTEPTAQTGAMVSKPAIARSGALGRPASTSRAELEQISLAMFAEQGFDVTSVDQIAAAAGIGRRTFFRYFKSKNDVVWGDFDTQLKSFTDWFEHCPQGMGLLDAICAGVIEFNSFDAETTTSLRNRMRVILGSQALEAYSTLRYRAWREVVSRFAAKRLGVAEDALIPRTLGRLALGCALAAYEQWLADDGENLLPLLRETLAVLRDTRPLDAQ